jgi:hypothetical protein
MVRPAGFEPATLCLEGRCSIRAELWAQSSGMSCAAQSPHVPQYIRVPDDVASMQQVRRESASGHLFRPGARLEDGPLSPGSLELTRGYCLTRLRRVIGCWRVCRGNPAESAGGVIHSPWVESMRNRPRIGNNKRIAPRQGCEKTQPSSAGRGSYKRSSRSCPCNPGNQACAPFACSIFRI